MRRFEAFTDWLMKLAGRPGLSKRPAPPVAIEELMERLLASRDVEWTCDDVHRCLDQYAELMVRGARGGADAARVLPMVQQHLDMCPDCREEYEALLRILRAQ